ncbi:hypothetical protein PAMP_014808 [Pampus punctatissimus]
MALSRFPSFFHSDNEPRPQWLGLGLRQSQIGQTRAKCQTDEVGWEVVFVNMNQTTYFKPGLDLFFLIIRCATLCPTLSLQSLSEQATCVPPVRKVMHLKTR